MNILAQKIKLVWNDQVLRNRVLFVLFGFMLFRVLANIPMPGADLAALARLLSGEGGDLLGFLNIFSGGGFANLSIALLGVGPYITASIIMQLVGMMSPKVKEMQRESEAGRKKISMYSRVMSVPLAAIQGFGLIKLLQSQGVLGNLSNAEMFTNILIVVAGSVLLMWIGELVSEFGIGNGISLVIFAGIVAILPGQLFTLYQNLTVDPTLIALYGLFVVVTFAVIWAIVYITEAERPIPISNAKQSRGSARSTQAVQNYLPLRLNQAGVIPIIFAISVLIFPQMVAQFLSVSTNPALAEIGRSILVGLANLWIYGGAYFVLTFLFTYFYTAVTFDPKQVADNLQKQGSFVPGVRPGTQTETYLGDVMTKITLVGAIFLAVVAVLPIVIQGITGLQSLAIGGTGLLIAVSVTIDLIKRLDSQITMREY